MLPYQDPANDGNSAKHRTGKACVVNGCKEPAGTWWGEHWCFKHNVERLDRIGANLDQMADKVKFSSLVDEAVQHWRAACTKIRQERNAILRAAGGKVTATRSQHLREAKRWGHSSHRDGSETYEID